MNSYSTPIAVVGIGGIFPGAPTTLDFWRDRYSFMSSLNP